MQVTSVSISPAQGTKLGHISLNGQIIASSAHWEKAILCQWPFCYEQVVQDLLGPGGKTWVLSSGRGNKEIWPWPQLPLSPHGVSAETDRLWYEVPLTPCSMAGATTHHPGNQDCPVLSAASIASIAQAPPVSLSQCGMGTGNPILPVVCATMGLCAQGGDASGWARRDYAQNWHPDHLPHPQYCALIPRPELLSGWGASHQSAQLPSEAFS